MVPKKAKIYYFLSGFFLLTAILIYLSFLFKNFEKTIQEKNLIYQNIYIDNIDFSLKSKKNIFNYFEKKSEKLKNLTFDFYLDNNLVATFSGKDLKVKYNTEKIWEEAYSIGREKSYLVSFFQKLLSFLKIKKINLSSNIEFDENFLKKYLNLLKKKYDKKAKNAIFELKNNKVTAFRKEENGKEINIEKTMKEFKNILNSLKNKEENKKIKIKSIVIKPKVTLSSINKFGIEELISIGKSDYKGSTQDRIHNIKLASLKLHGVLIPPKQIFSFNQTIGEVSSFVGYQPAYIIKEGRTVIEDGGGICQVSTTLFRTALNAGLPIIERHNHEYRVPYYEKDMPPGFDAAVFSPYVDLKIKNDLNSYILIQTSIDEENSLLYIYFYGKKDNRKVEISKPVIWDLTPPPPPKYQEDPSLKKGIIKQIDFPFWGAKVFFKYKVYKNGKLIIDKDFSSFYKPWQAVYLLGTK